MTEPGLPYFIHSATTDIIVLQKPNMVSPQNPPSIRYIWKGKLPASSFPVAYPYFVIVRSQYFPEKPVIAHNRTYSGKHHALSVFHEQIGIAIADQGWELNLAESKRLRSLLTPTSTPPTPIYHSDTC